MAHNPAFNEKTLDKMAKAGAFETTDTMTMTVNGTVNKVGILVLLTMLSSAFAWSIADTGLGALLALGSLIFNLVLCFVIIFKKNWAPTLAPVYAMVEGLLIGFISYFANSVNPGVALHALVGTFAILFAMLGLYHFRVLQATPKFQKTVILATFGIASLYLLDLGMMFFAHTRIPFIHEGGIYGILFSVFVVGLASMHFILDFDMIEKAAQRRAPKYMEWYAGFAVLLTIVWLYLEILRLLGKARN